MITALVLLPLTLVATTEPASATTSQFRGVNWAVAGDNFSKSPLVIDGLSSSDSYATVKAKANSVYNGLASTLNANTVRIPINTVTVGTAWWNNYRGVIDAATDRGWKVIVAYWEDGAASAGKITNLSAWNSMWSTVVSEYSSNSLVYYEPMNEPHGYSSSDWRNVAAAWLSAHSTAAKNHVLIGGVGFSQDLNDLCGDSRFNSVLFSFHTYTFMYAANTYDGWRSNITSHLGNCASRAVATEYGAEMNSGLNFNDANSTDNFVRYFRAVTQVMRDNTMGGSYWPAIGGKQGSIGYDHYSLFSRGGSGTNITLTLRNQSGIDRLRYGWGDTVGGGSGGGSSAATIVNQNSGKCMDVVSASTANNGEIDQYTCNGGSNQKWTLSDAGSGYYNIVSVNSGKCLDVTGASTADGAALIQYTCGSGTNQQFAKQAAGSYYQLVARNSGKCIDVPSASTANGIRLKQYTCTTATSQRWSIN